ncbi:hypothetical protein DFH09DRAFT_1183014 [Mycena vulgaris]|nr:hypothetical protein DFH09DRAFT_1183014 [Mycena vulgaris]
MPTSFRERVDVTSTIRSILDSYPLGNGILRELLQNSDDASATKQIFILDQRTYPSKSLVDPDLVHSQGPSLLAINDSIFTEADWKAIRTIHDSSKTKDETKLGKFGIGARACYHITDNPHFLSGDASGISLGIFDPHERFSGQNAGGVQIDVAAEGSSYRDQLLPFEQFIGSTSADFTGTVVRLPLRTLQQAPKSRIKPTAVDPFEIQTLFNEFVQKELSVVMLFLKHIRFICLKIIDSDGVETFVGSAEIPDTSISEKRAFSRTDDAREETFTCTVTTKASHAPPVSKGWRILHTVQSKSDTLTALNDRLGYKIEATLLAKDKLFSHVALAFPLNHDESLDGRLFTLLPLPIHTGFPVHIHAILALTQDRQSLRNIEEIGTSPESRERLLVTWNRSVFDLFLPAAWSALLRILVENGELEDIWSAWPALTQVNINGSSYWSQILPYLAANVLDSDLPVFPIFPNGQTYVSLSSAFIASEEDDTVLMALSKAGLPIVKPPGHIREALRPGSDALKFLNPTSVRGDLLSHIPSLNNVSEEDKDHILRYLVLAPGTISDVIGLPLVPLVDGSRIPLSHSLSKIYVVVTEQEEKVFRDCDDGLIALSRMSPIVAKAFFAGSSTVNIARLDNAKVKFYLESRFNPARGQAGDEVEWLTRFWGWMSAKANKEALLPLIHHLPLLLTTQGTLRKMQSRIALPIGGRPGNRDKTMQAWSTLGAHFLHSGLIPYQTAFHEYAVEADDIIFLVEAISTDCISTLEEDTVRLIQDHIVQSVPTLTDSLKQNPAKRPAFIAKFRQLPIFPIRVVAQNQDENQLSEIRVGEASGPLTFVRITDRCPVPLMSDQTFFDVGSSSGILGNVIDPIIYNRAFDELGVLTMAIDHLNGQSAENMEALLARIIRRLPDLPLPAKDKLHSVPFVSVQGRPEKMPPNQVIDPESKLAEIYRGEPGRLPDDLWAKEYLPLLKPYGFFIQTLTPGIVTERIAYLSKNWTGPADSPVIHTKAKWFSLLLNSHWDSTSQHINISNFLAAKWLPLKDCNQLAAPIESRDESGSHSHYLFDLVLPIVDVTILNKGLREALGWAQIPMQVLQSQFHRALTDSSPLRPTRFYLLIKELSRRLPELSDEDMAGLKNAASDNPWVPESGSGSNSIRTKYALLKFSKLGRPFQTVPLDLLDGQGRDFLQKMGCLDSPSFDTLLTELQSIAARNALTTNSWQVIEILNEIAAIVPDPTHADYSRIMVPGKDGILHPIAQVYFVDTVTDFSPDVDFRATDSRMSESLARALKIQFLSSMELGNEDDEDEDDDLQMGEDFTKRVKSVLQEYDVEYALNEYLANAVDAKATEFSVILDERTFESSKVIGPKFTDLQQRPSLFLFNNAVFTPADFHGLRTVGFGGKISDPDSIGRYGLGALSLFHFTDVVHLVSGGYFLILDPSGDYLPAFKNGRPRTSLKMSLSKLFRRYPDHMSCFNSLHGFSASESNYNGTLFRLPLRRESSGISPKARSIYDCLNLLNGTYFSLAKDAMPFTRLNHISANQRPQVGAVTSLWSVSASRSSEALDDDENPINREIKWFVTGSITSQSLVPVEYDRSKVGLVARMAFLLTETPGTLAETPMRCSLFSTLRLPVQTTLPAHIHAQFALSSDRRHIRFEPPDGSGKRILQAAYNQWILSHLIPPLYISSISLLSKLSSAEPFAWWPTLPMASDEISRTVIHAFYDLFPTSSVPICSTVTSQPIAPIDAVFCGCDTPTEVINVLDVLECPNFVRLHRQEIYDSIASGHLRGVDPAFVQQILESRGAALPDFFTTKRTVQKDATKKISQKDVDRTLIFLLKGKIPVSGLPLLIQADNRLVFATSDGPVKYAPQGHLIPPFFPQDRFLQLSAEARGLILQADVNVKPFDEAAVLGLLAEQIPAQPRCTHSSATIEWITEFWNCYEQLPGPPLPSSFDTVPLIPTTNGDHISVSYCRRVDVMRKPGPAETDAQLVAAMQKLGIIFYLPPPPLQPSCDKPFTLQTCLPALHSKISSFSELSFDETIFVGDWIRSRIYFCTDADKSIIAALPIWEALQGNSNVFLSEPHVYMLPFPSLHRATFATYLRPAIALAEYSLPLETVMGWSPVRRPMASTGLAQILTVPENLPTTEVEPYVRLLQALFSLQDGGKWQLRVPDGNLVLRPADQLYDPSQALFSAALTLERSEQDLFLHPSFRNLAPQLRSKGLKYNVDWDLFLRCARCIHAEAGRRSDAEMMEKARVVYDFYNSHLPTSAGAGSIQQWEKFNTIASSRAIHSYCRAGLPAIVSPSLLLVQKYEQVAWSQRALFQDEPLRMLTAVNPSLGVPNANEVVNHLEVLALRVARDHPGDQTLLMHLRATYLWLNQNVDDAKDFLRGRGNLFLNVTNPDTDSWDWCSAEQLFFDARYDYPELGSYRVRDFLQDYRRLLIAAGASVEGAPEFRAAAGPQDSSRFRAEFNIMRQQKQLTDIRLIPTAVPTEEDMSTEEIWVHSTVLAAAIPHVREALVNWYEGTAKEYQFPGTYFGACAIRDFIYTGRIERTISTDEDATDLMRNLLELLQVADQWDMPELKDEIGRLIDEKGFLFRDTYQMILTCAKERRAAALIEYCEDWAIKNPGSVSSLRR